MRIADALLRFSAPTREETVFTPGVLYGCGLNVSGQLGMNNATAYYKFVQIGSSVDWVQTSVRESHSMAINNKGELYGCGNNGFYQLGLGSSVDIVRTFTRVGAASNWIRVACGQIHTVALNTLGEIWTCGKVAFGDGSLGLGSTTAADILTKVGMATNWTAIATSGRHTLALNSSGELYSFGWNEHGQLGVGDTTNRNTPTRVGSATNWVSIHASSLCSYAINNLGELYVWGTSEYGGLGLGQGVTTVNVPTKVGMATNWSKLWGRNFSTFALNTAGELYAFGENTNGELALGDTDDRWEPTRVGTTSDWVAGSSGQFISLAVNASGHVYACGGAAIDTQDTHRSARGLGNIPGNTSFKYVGRISSGGGIPVLSSFNDTLLTVPTGVTE